MKEHWASRAKTSHKNFDELKKDAAAYQAWRKAITRTDLAAMRRQAATDAIAWSNGIIANEEAFRILQRDNPREAERVRYHEQFSNDLTGMLVLLPGVKGVLERRLVAQFRREGGPLRVEAQVQPYVWGRPAEESYIIRFLRRGVSASMRGLAIAELWFGAHRKNPGIVRAGRLPMDLDRFAARAGEQLLGPGRTVIGQLFKVLDAKEPLSMQMHERFKPNSKNESWMVVIDRERLRAEGRDQMIADIYIGFRPVDQIAEADLPGFRAAYEEKPTAEGKAEYYRARYAAALEEGVTDTEGRAIKAFSNRLEVRWEGAQVEVYLNGAKQPASVKEALGVNADLVVMNVPGATVHALAYGTIYEVQETADRTLRLYDQGRNDPNRPLHIKEALNLLDFTPREPMQYLVSPVELERGVTNLIRTPLYALDRVETGSAAQGRQERLEVTMGPSYQMLMVTEGEGVLRSRPVGQAAERELAVRAGDTLIVPAGLGQYVVESPGGMVLLKAYEASAEEISQGQALRGGKSFWEEEGFFTPAERAAQAPEGTAQAVQAEMRRVQEILPEGVNRPIRGVRSLPARLLDYGLRTVLFATDGQGAANLNLRLPVRALATVLLAGLVVMQVAVGAVAGITGAPVTVDDRAPRFEAFKRALALPDAVAAREYNVKQIRFRPLSELGTFWQRLLRGQLLGAYRENYQAAEHGEWASIFVPDSLLRTMSGELPAADSRLRTALARLSYRLQAMLFGAIVGYQAEQYYQAGRWDSVAQTFGLARAQLGVEEGLAPVTSLVAGETAVDWLSAKRSKLGVGHMEFLSLVAGYLAETQAVLGKTPDRSLGQLKQAMEQELTRGAEPSLAAILRVLRNLPGMDLSSEAGLLQAAIGEALELEGTGREVVTQAAAGRVIRGAAGVKPGAWARTVETAAPIAGQEVYVQSLPKANQALQAAVAQALASLRGRREAAGLISRLEMAQAVLANLGTAPRGHLSLLDTATAQKLRGELELQARQETARVAAIGEDLSRMIHGVATGRVQTVQIGGIELAQAQVFQVSAPVNRQVALAEVLGAALPEELVAQPYAGEVEEIVAAPRPVRSLFLNLLPLLTSRRMHQVTMRVDPMGYLRALVNRMETRQSALHQQFSQPASPVVQAYLRYVANPGSRNAERNFIKTMLRALKAEAALADTQPRQMALLQSAAAFNELVAAMRALSPSAELGAWAPEAGTRLAGKAIHVPGVLLEVGGKGALGAYYDILHTLPAKVNENALELQRRKLFRSSAVAA